MVTVHDDLTPRERIELECAARGKPVVVAGCVKLVLGGDTDARLLSVLGGRTTRWALEDDGRRHWFRIWGARGLLWAWEESALDAIIAATTDEAWRVRELAAKVIARHLVGDALPAVVPLQRDPIPRVRAAAIRAVTRITQAGA
jgi:HEAT repeat protein